jgi:hypothetical protein
MVLKTRLVYTVLVAASLVTGAWGCGGDPPSPPPEAPKKAPVVEQPELPEPLPEVPATSSPPATQSTSQGTAR